MEFALPLLRKARRRAAFFLVPGALGGRSEWERAFGLELSELMTWSDARAIAGEGMSIGSHSMTHADLRQTDESSIGSEVVRSREELEQRLGISVRSFAVPFGRDDGRLDGALERAGYLRKFTNPIAASIKGPIAAYGVTGVLRSIGVNDLRRLLSGADALVWWYHRTRARLGGMRRA